MAAALAVAIVVSFGNFVRLGASAAAAAERPIELNDLWSLRTIQRVKISPDGTRILFSVTLPANDVKDELKLFDVASGRIDDVDLGQGRHQDRHGGDVHWTAAGDGLLFLQTEEGKTSCWQWDLATKSSRQLFAHDAASSYVPQYEESPDGRRIAFVTVSSTASADAARRKQALATTGVVLGEENGQRYPSTIPVEIWVWDRETQQKQRVYGGRYVTSLHWSPDSSKLAVEAMVARKVMLYSLYTPGGNSGTGVTVIDVASGASQKLRDLDLQEEEVLGWSPDSRTLAVDSQAIDEVVSSSAGVLGMTKGKQVTAWTLPRDRAAFHKSDDPLLRERAGPPRVQGFDGGDWFHWHDNGTLYYSTTIGDRTTVMASAKPGTAGAPLSDRKWHLSKLSFATRAEFAAGIRESVNEPPELALIDLRTGGVKTLTSLNAPVTALRRPEAGPYRVTNRFGYETVNWLIKPPDYKPGRKYPLVILLYSFNNAFAAQPWMKNFAPYEYARLGTMVLLANYPAFDGRGIGADASIPERWRFSLAMNPLASFEAAVDRLAADGLIDQRRVALYGFSYGAFLTQYAITHSSKFSVAFVNDGGAWNPGVYLNTGMKDSSYLLAFDYLFGGPPFGRGAQAMREFLPAYGFSRLAVPVLFEGHGGDEALPSYADFYLTARQDGAPIEAVIYKDAHILTGRERQRSSIGRSADWLRYWLLDSENPTPLDPDQYVRWAELRRRLAVLESESISRR
jgi:dipeptidyl aminopeptidase/acylaminoacyl peptidase